MSNKHHFKDSSSLKYCDFHENTGTMEIGFNSGSIYHYPDCSKSHYDALKNAESPGKHFHTAIRSKRSIKVTR